MHVVICLAIDMSPLVTQALKHLRTAQFCPLVVFIKAASADGVRRLHHSARVDAPGGFTQLNVSIYIHTVVCLYVCVCVVF